MEFRQKIAKKKEYIEKIFKLKNIVTLKNHFNISSCKKELSEEEEDDEETFDLNKK